MTRIGMSSQGSNHCSWLGLTCDWVPCSLNLQLSVSQSCSSMLCSIVPIQKFETHTHTHISFKWTSLWIQTSDLFHIQFIIWNVFTCTGIRTFDVLSTLVMSMLVQLRYWPMSDEVSILSCHELVQMIFTLSFWDVDCGSKQADILCSLYLDRAWVLLFLALKHCWPLCLIYISTQWVMHSRYLYSGIIKLTYNNCI